MVPVTKAASFQELCTANETMCLAEVLIFLRDFKVVPCLLSKREVNEIWGLIATEWVHSGRGTLRQLDVEGFKDLFVRIAIVAYNKPGLKSMTKRVIGGELLPSEAVMALCNYLNLYDEYCVREYTRDVGRKTQGLLNMRSESEKDDTKRREDYEQDKMIRRMQAQVHLKEREKEKETEKKMKKKKKPQDTSRARSNRSSMFRRQEPKQFESYLPPVMQKKLYPERDIQISEEEQRLYRATVPEDQQAGDDIEDEDENWEDEDEEGLFESGSGDLIAEITAGPHVSPAILLQDYDKGLVRHITQYFYNTPDDANDHIMHSEGCFLDMGRLPIGAKCLVRLHVFNKSSDELELDVSTRGFEAEHIKLTSFPKLMVAGLSEYVGISFNIGTGSRAVIGYIDIHTYCSHTKSSSVASVPVFYKVGPSLPTDKLHPLATVRTITNLQLSYECSVQRPQTVNFATKSGTWNSSPPSRLSPTKTLQPLSPTHRGTFFPGPSSPTQQLGTAGGPPSPTKTLGFYTSLPSSIPPRASPSSPLKKLSPMASPHKAYSVVGGAVDGGHRIEEGAIGRSQSAPTIGSAESWGWGV